MSFEILEDPQTVFAPLNTQIDADRDYRDNVLSGCGCGCGGAGPCPQGLSDLGENKLVLYGVPLLLLALWAWPMFLGAEEDRGR